MTTTPPPLRTFPRAAVTLRDGSMWQHGSVLGKYTEQELASILAYLHEVVRPQ